jgi:hypothetical protein
MLEWRYNYDKVTFMSHEDLETTSFFRNYLSYLTTLKFDDIYHWREEDIQFYNSQTFEMPSEENKVREDFYHRIIEAY